MEARAVTMARLLVVCVGFDTLQYRVLRCAADAGAEVHVLGTAAARRVASSRFCAGFRQASHLDEPVDVGRAADEIDRAAEACGAEMVVPGDGRAVRLLARARGLLRSSCFPVPPAAAFDLLNDKWRFAGLCAELGVRHPAPRLFADRLALEGAVARGEVALPLVAKPTDQAGGRGVSVIRVAGDLARRGRLTRLSWLAGAPVDYRPILAQPYVDGDDLCLSAMCRDGEIVAHVVYGKRGGDCLFTESPELVHLAGQVLRHVGYQGVVNFDARVDRGGRVHLIECNPRFWYTMDMTLLAGVNFVRLGLEAAVPRDVGARTVGAVLRSNRSLLRALGRPWTMTSTDLMAIRHRLRDPVPVLDELAAKLRDRLGVAPPQG